MVTRVSRGELKSSNWKVMEASFYFESFEEGKEEFKPMKIRCAEISSFSDVAPEFEEKKFRVSINYQIDNK